MVMLFFAIKVAKRPKNESKLIVVGFAIWEPPHGRYKMFKYPWKCYVKLSGGLEAFVRSCHGIAWMHPLEIRAPPNGDKFSKRVGKGRSLKVRKSYACFFEKTNNQFHVEYQKAASVELFNHQSSSQERTVKRARQKAS
ncbi:hypothetical protein Syun_023721 [Stephania yunnanensis]|uniref:Uncharacterized protein n=1 Tax=Stephania yunnanensis TaxID=152371 RepID=A0AAP0F9F9_9MAGN